MRIAIVGSGIAGLSAAWLLNCRHDVDLYEKKAYFGGHTNTRMVDTEEGRVPVDTGFIVFNRRNYPQLTQLFRHLGVRTQPAPMSFAVSANHGQYEYAGSGLNSLFAQRGNLLNLQHYQMLVSILRFNRDAKRLLQDPPGTAVSVAEFLKQGGYGTSFRDRYLLPMAAAIWSCPVETMAEFPATSLIRFFANHGLLDLRNRPQWRTVCGGSHQYVERLLASLQGGVACRERVTAVERCDRGVLLHGENGLVTHYDAVVMACHADQALQLLDRPTPQENRVLGAFRYQDNRAVLHSDTSLMPRRRSVWSAWNYLSNENRHGAAAVSVTYWMNCLQRLDQTPPLFVSLNPLREARDDTVIAEMDYSHPIFDQHTASAQERLGQLQGVGGIWYCGSYFGYGFHEDALCSSVSLARQLGVDAPWQSSAPERDPLVAQSRPAWLLR